MKRGTGKKIGKILLLAVLLAMVGVIVYAVMASVCFFGAPWLIGFFGLNGASAQVGVQYMRFTAPRVSFPQISPARRPAFPRTT